MDMEIVGDVSSLDPELLQLPEIPSFVLKSSPYIADELFSQWLSLPESVRLVCILFRELRACFLLPWMEGRISWLIVLFIDICIRHYYFFKAITR